MSFMVRHFRASAVVVVFLFFGGIAAPALGDEASIRGSDDKNGVRPAAKVTSTEAKPRNEEMVVAARPAVEKGLKYLATHQQDDGAFSNSGYGRNAAVVALAGMAWLAGGNTPGRGPYGEQVGRVTEYLLEHCEQSGFISVEGAQSHGPMYEHGFATLFLAEVYGMSPRDDIRDKLARAVDLIVRTQNSEGGWRYQPRREDADISVTICQVMALRAARNAGLKVPSETVDRCVDYVKRSQNADGGFRYMLSPGESLFPRSAAGVVVLNSAGVYKGAKLSAGWRMSINICRVADLVAGKCRMGISFMGITTPFRRCGRPMASGGSDGILRFVICW